MFNVVLSQVRLLLWKRYCEVSKNRLEFLRIIGPPVVIFVLIHLAYATLPLLRPGGVEPLLVPFAFFLFLQRVVIQISYEKANRLYEAMKMMGLIEISYWLSYFLSEAVVTGTIIALTGAIVSGGALFNEGDFGAVLGLLLVFSLSVVPFCFFVSVFFDSPQSAGQGIIGVFIGLFAVYVIVFLTQRYPTSLYTAQVVGSLFPPLALQVGCSSFLASHEGLSLSGVCAIMVADIFLYSLLTWYFLNVWPSTSGVPRPFYFPLLSSYWTGGKESPNYQKVGSAEKEEGDRRNREEGDREMGEESTSSAVEEVNEVVLGKPSVIVSKLRKSFKGSTVVRDLSFSLYENQIFSLLGHNGAGKTTTLGMLTGLFSPDVSLDGTVRGSASVYGHSINSNMHRVRQSLGVCPQHDVLFDQLTVKEHLLFFARLKGRSKLEAEQEALHLLSLFRLDRRQENRGEELSGGQRRKLSVAIAVCGGSKLVILDEPTAGLDPLARRELWTLLSSLRRGRTMLLTTHYMDEAEVLGDRVGVMSHGVMVCTGSPQFLKRRFGCGYRLIVEYNHNNNNEEGLREKREKTLSLIERHVSSSLSEQESRQETAVFLLSYSDSCRFSSLFDDLDQSLLSLDIKSYGLSGSSLEDVFLRTNNNNDNAVNTNNNKDRLDLGGLNQRFHPRLFNQILGTAYRKLNYAANDFSTVPLLLLPMLAAGGAAAIYSLELISSQFSVLNALIANALYCIGYVGIPGLLAEFVVRERVDRLRNVLDVMGCDYRSYWIGTFLADFLLLLPTSVVLWVTWVVCDMTSYYQSLNGLNFFVCLLFNAQLISFSYLCSYLFESPKSCVSFLPTLIVALDVTPSFVFSIFNQLLEVFQKEAGAPSRVVGSVIYWATVLLSPQGGLFACFLDIGEDLSLLNVASFPPFGASIAIMIVQTVLFLSLTMIIDERSLAVLSPVLAETGVDEKTLDEDVLRERQRVLQSTRSPNPVSGSHADVEQGASNNNDVSDQSPLRIERLRRLYPPVKTGGAAVLAVEDVTFALSTGEVFGLLGANGAGKTTLLSMLTRLTAPTSGNAFVAGFSILSDFRGGVAPNLGVVTQNNALWDRLSVESHLFLFARLRGVPEDRVRVVVEDVLTQMDLQKHRKKLSFSLSGGMKRKLCVAIALIGDPRVVLLDEPSAGLDPVSRRNLWDVISRTMSHRSVVLTTHSMEEAEALCSRLAVMVAGQLRAIGSKQHLKSKFGHGYELTVKLSATLFSSPSSAANALSLAVDSLSSFLSSLFPSARFVYENGGLVTFQIASRELRMSVLFGALEREKERLGVEDYSLAQPTLEQVFIRIVQETTGSLEAANHFNDQQNQSGGQASEVIEKQDLRMTRAKCGCSDYCLRSFVYLCLLFFAIMVVIGGVVGAGGDAIGGAVSITIGVVFIIVMLVLLSLLCCLSCRVPVDEV